MATQKSEAWVIHEQEDTILLNEKIMQNNARKRVRAKSGKEMRRNRGNSGDHEWKVGELATRTTSKISTIRMEIMEQERHSSRRTQTKKEQIGGTRQKGTRNNEQKEKKQTLFFFCFSLRHYFASAPVFRMLEPFIFFLEVLSGSFIVSLAFLNHFFASLVLYFWTHCS